MTSKNIICHLIITVMFGWIEARNPVVEQWPKTFSGFYFSVPVFDRRIGRPVDMAQIVGDREMGCGREISQTHHAVGEIVPPLGRPF